MDSMLPMFDPPSYLTPVVDRSLNPDGTPNISFRGLEDPETTLTKIFNAIESRSAVRLQDTISAVWKDYERSGFGPFQKEHDLDTEEGVLRALDGIFDFEHHGKGVLALQAGLKKFYHVTIKWYAEVKQELSRYPYREWFPCRYYLF